MSPADGNTRECARLDGIKSDDVTRFQKVVEYLFPTD